MKKLFSSILKPLRAIAFMEGITFLLLIFVTMPMRYLIDIPMPNKIIGMLHGGLFLAYSGLVVWATFKYKWPIWIGLLAFIASFIPFGTFLADDKIFKNPKYNE